MPPRSQGPPPAARPRRSPWPPWAPQGHAGSTSKAPGAAAASWDTEAGSPVAWEGAHGYQRSIPTLALTPKGSHSPSGCHRAKKGRHQRIPNSQGMLPPEGTSEAGLDEAESRVTTSSPSSSVLGRCSDCGVNVCPGHSPTRAHSTLRAAGRSRPWLRLNDRILFSSNRYTFYLL